MNWTGQVRTWHRWISVVVGIQLLAWTLGGLVFSLEPIEDVRGDSVLAPDPPHGSPPLQKLVPLSLARATVGTTDLAGAQLAWMRGRWVWALRPAPGSPPLLVDARRNVRLGLVGEEEAAGIARRRFTGSDEVLDVQRVDSAEGEYRKKVVPAWRVCFADPLDTHVYVDARTGAISAVRTDTWRRFDFFWMLHIMSYESREDFHHPLLTGAAALGVSTAITGLWLGVLVLRPRRRKAAGDRPPPGA